MVKHLVAELCFKIKLELKLDPVLFYCNLALLKLKALTLPHFRSYCYQVVATENPRFKNGALSLIKTV